MHFHKAHSESLIPPVAAASSLWSTKKPLYWWPLMKKHQDLDVEIAAVIGNHDTLKHLVEQFGVLHLIKAAKG